MNPFSVRRSVDVSRRNPGLGRECDSVIAEIGQADGVPCWLVRGWFAAQQLADIEGRSRNHGLDHKASLRYTARSRCWTDRRDCDAHTPPCHRKPARTQRLQPGAYTSLTFPRKWCRPRWDTRSDKLGHRPWNQSCWACFGTVGCARRPGATELERPQLAPLAGAVSLDLPRSCQLCLDYSPGLQGGIDDSLAKTAADFPVQLFCSLDNRHVGSISDTRVSRPARLHLENGGSVLTTLTLKPCYRLLRPESYGVHGRRAHEYRGHIKLYAAPRMLDRGDPSRPGGIDPSYNPPAT